MSFTFSSLSQETQKALKELSFLNPTEIQKSAIPKALEGYDILGQAATGTGKTAAFGIPIIEKVKKGEVFSALILSPTRELAIQIKEQLFALSKYKALKVFVFYGGTPVKQNVSLLSKTKPEIVVGTPGRIEDLANRGLIDFSKIKFFVLDEVDHMLDMGFIENIEKIIQRLPKERQSFMFSATIPKEIERLAKRYLKEDYQFIKIYTNETKPRIEEKIIRLSSSKEKFSELVKLLDHHKLDKVIIFVKMKKDAKELSQSLQEKGFRAQSIHGDLNQRQRERALSMFKNSKVNILVATDVAARGIDIKDISLVINYHLPEDPEIYIHRIGRTGRIGRIGKAISLAAPEDSRTLSRIKKLTQAK